MKSKPQKDLIRIVCNGSKLSVDYTGKADGRGVYLCRNEECIRKAMKGKAFNRSYKRAFDRAETNAVFEELLEKVKEVEND